jgi:hypothetical protein
MPVIALVCRVPRVVVPVPAVWVKEAAVMAPAVTSWADERVNARRGVVPPTAPSKKMSPVPAMKVAFCAPFNVLNKWMLPPERLVSMVDWPAKVTGV